MAATIIRVQTDDHQAAWLALRCSLWLEVPAATHAEEIAGMAAEPDKYAAFPAEMPDAGCVGCAEAAHRHDYVNGCDTNRVAFLEGIFVVPAHRRQGIVRALCAAVEDWAAALGCLEFASDADIANVTSQNMHAALGFAETERVVFFRKVLNQ